MNQQTIFLKGMVCNRCLMTVETELQEMGHTPVKLSLGEVSYISNKAQSPAALEERLTLLGFSFLEDKKVKMTKEVKKNLEKVYSGDFDFPDNFRFANLIKQQFQKDYDTISDAFIATEKKTIEQYIIEFRINKIKEYLVYTNLTLADIAFKLNFNSIAHLSAQFKQQTGLTPSFFKNVKRQKPETVFSVN
jgi:AraC family transcriptional regulator